MKILNRTSIFLRSLAICSAVVIGSVNAEAVTLNYSFTMNNNGFSMDFVAANPSDSRFFHGPGTIDVSYDTVTEAMSLTASSTGTIFGGTPANFLDPANILVSNVTATAVIAFTHIIPGINPGGLVGLFSAGTTGAGTFNVSDLGLGTGGTSFNVMSMPMSGADFAALPAANTDFFDLLSLANGIYWQFLVTRPASTIFNKIASFSWYNSINPVVINGINYGHPHTDLLGVSTNSVPEPATYLLLSVMLIAAFIGNRRQIWSRRS